MENLDESALNVANLYISCLLPIRAFMARFEDLHLFLDVSAFG